MTNVELHTPQLDTCIAALADPTRRKVFEHVVQTPQPVGAIAAKLPVSRPAVSQHLKTLAVAGLITAKAEGTRRIYSANPAGIQLLRSYLDGLWSDALNAFADSFDEKDSQK